MNRLRRVGKRVVQRLLHANLPPGSQQRADGSAVEDIFAVQLSLLQRKPVRSIFDVGANRGDTVARYLETFPDARILAFEPTPELVNVLKSRFAANPNVAVQELAIGEQMDRKDLFLYDRDMANSLVELKDDRYIVGGTRSQGRVTVDVATLDRFCELNTVDEIDILKLDIQGTDLRALQGARELLGAGRVRLLIIELLFVDLYVGQCYAWEVCSHLHDAGYPLFNLYNVRTDLDGQLKWADGIFLRRG
jgi:FkbM family methyltransferase